MPEPWFDELAEFLRIPSVSADPTHAADVVRAAIDKLPDGYRTILLLRDIEELSTEETARMLGINQNTVKVRLHRARQALRAILDPHMRGAIE